MTYLAWRRQQRRRRAKARPVHFNEPRRPARIRWRPAAGVSAAGRRRRHDIVFTLLIPEVRASTTLALTPDAKPITLEVSRLVAIWAVEAALLLGIATVVIVAWPRIAATFVKGDHAALSGCLLASVNTASEYGSAR